MTTDEKLDEKIEKKIERIRHILSSIEPNKVTILTGSNGSGKSLIRKQCRFELSRKIPDTDPMRLTADVSMQRRTENNPFLGAMCSFMHDDANDPTSYSTYHFIDTLLNSFVKEKDSKRYLIIDEPEIGMSKESQLGFIIYLKNRMSEILEHTYGLLIITHSEIIVDAMKEDAVFLNMDSNCSADEWINREIIPTDFETLSKDSHELFHAINRQSKDKAKKDSAKM
jgi:ABC-type dipeptide/oligopeptide/nickel transport system ATPase component